MSPTRAPGPRDSIGAHLTIVFTTLAIARYLQHCTGISIKKIVRTLRRIHTDNVDIDGHELTARTPQDDETQAILAVISTRH